MRLGTSFRPHEEIKRDGEKKVYPEIVKQRLSKRSLQMNPDVPNVSRCSILGCPKRREYIDKPIDKSSEVDFPPPVRGPVFAIRTLRLTESPDWPPPCDAKSKLRVSSATSVL
jgi:hypothetical protein